MLNAFTFPERIFRTKLESRGSAEEDAAGVAEGAGGAGGGVAW